MARKKKKDVVDLITKDEDTMKILKSCDDQLTELEEEKEKKPTHLSEEEMEKLIKEYHDGLVALEESRRDFNDRFKDKSEEDVAKELGEVYSEVEESAKKEGVEIIYVGDDDKENKD